MILIDLHIMTWKLHENFMDTFRLNFPLMHDFKWFSIICIHFQVIFNNLHGFKWFSLVVVTSQFLTTWYYFQCLFYFSFIISFSIYFWVSIIFPIAYNMEQVIWEVEHFELLVFAWISWIAWFSCFLNVWHLFLILSLDFSHISFVDDNFLWILV